MMPAVSIKPHCSTILPSVIFLASPDGDAYTGQTLDPNGGVVTN